MASGINNKYNFGDNNRMKEKIWKILAWIDDNINHGIIEEIFDLFPIRHDNKFDLLYWIWNNTCYRYCYWISVDLYDKWENENKE
jgi:hypothetical protein